MMIKCSEGEKSDYNLKLYVFNGKVMVKFYCYLPIPVKFYFTPFYRLQFKFTPIKKLYFMYMYFISSQYHGKPCNRHTSPTCPFEMNTHAEVPVVHAGVAVPAGGDNTFKAKKLCKQESYEVHSRVQN